MPRSPAPVATVAAHILQSVLCAPIGSNYFEAETNMAVWQNIPGIAAIDDIVSLLFGHVERPRNHVILTELSRRTINATTST